MKKVIVGVILAGVIPFTYANSLMRCEHLFYAKTAPVVVNKLLAKNNFEICFTGFAVNYSGTSKTGIWSAALLTPESLEKAYKLPRTNPFHEEERIPLQYRALLSDYKSSGFQRGHLSPNGDRYSVEDQFDSFSTVNLIPQSPYNNQEVWRNLEEAVRAYITKNKQPAYVITGPLFLGNKLRKIGNNMLVPSHVYKVVLFPKLNVAGAYVAVNDETGRVDVVSINQLQHYSGLIFFPNAAESAVFNYRILLPLNSHSAVKMTDLVTAPNSLSDIFAQLPKQGVENMEPKIGEIKSTVKQNREEAIGLAKGAVKSNIEIVTGWIKGALAK